jgi:hypothetical protein
VLHTNVYAECLGAAYKSWWLHLMEVCETIAERESLHDEMMMMMMMTVIG